MSSRYCLTLDLKNDPELIRQYEEYHRKVWPEVIESIKGSGIIDLQIFRLDTRMCMVMEVDDGFSFEKKGAADKANKKVQEWEELMWTFQQAVPGSGPGEKWRLMNKIFDLND